MIKVDLSNIWGELTLRDLLNVEKEVAKAHALLDSGQGAGGEYLGWRKLPEQPELLRRIQSTAQRLSLQSDIVVVAGIGGSYLGARAGIELLQGTQRNLERPGGSPVILFAGNNLSTLAWEQLRHILEGKDFSLIVVSKSGTTLETAIATRALRWLLERKYGTDGAKKRIVAVTDPMQGALRQLTEEEGWESFYVPSNVGSRFSVLTPAGLLPMAVAGLDVSAIWEGAMQAREDYELRSFDNPAWLYAAVRNLMYRKGKSVELLAGFEPGGRFFGAWWQQLFAQSEGKKGRGLLPVPVEFTADLHTMGQFLQQGSRCFFETTLRFTPGEQRVEIGSDYKNLDGLNRLVGKTLDDVSGAAYQAAVRAHTSGGVPVVTVEADSLCEKTLGALFYFMELSCGLSGYMLGVNPFNQPGLTDYKQELGDILS